MPFTFSHPALVLPLTKLPPKWFSLTGLIIGSVAPDFEYFFRMRMDSQISHTVQGLFLFDLPVGIVLTFIFHNLIRNGLYDNLPLILQRRLFHYKAFDWHSYFKRHVLVEVISILVGATSHLFWDSFTHNHAFFVERLPWLRRDFDLWGWPIPIYRVLQHISTIVGGMVIALFVLRMPETAVVGACGSFYYWPLAGAIALVIVLMRVCFPLDQKVFPQIIVTSISATLIALILTPLLVNKMRNRNV